jgi:hypothetical protein
MSVTFLRVDEANQNSSVAEISETLKCKSALITVLMWLKRIKIYIPLEIRRMIAIYCTVPNVTYMKCSAIKYWKFYSTHKTTQKYNPLICTTGRRMVIGNLSCIFGREQYNDCLHIFGHPLTNKLKEVSAMSFDIEDTKLDDFIYSAKDKSYITTIVVPVSANILAGIKHNDNVISIVAYTDIINSKPKQCFTLIKRIDLKSRLNVNMFDIRNGTYKKSLDNFSKKVKESYMPNYPPIHGFKHGFIRTYLPGIALMRLRIVAKQPIDSISILFGHIKPEFLL